MSPEIYCMHNLDLHMYTVLAIPVEIRLVQILISLKDVFVGFSKPTCYL